MKSQTTSGFRTLLARLPRHVRDQARRAHQLFLEDPLNRGLRFKQVHASRPIYSARVGLSYRALGIRDGETVIWFWIGTHAEYDRVLRGDV
ncbi:MAG: hypothetical protein FJ104_08830 [Deltaproteobacteria bacterium]|nr:hypothetical protein [Deltaproteobacteria bacterium]